MNDDRKQSIAVHEQVTGVRWWTAVCILLFSGTALILIQTGTISFSFRPSVDAIYIVWAFQEIARFTALDDRTWNHPTLAGNLLVIRNDREAACCRLPVYED